jgi:hypothetical protein
MKVVNKARSNSFQRMAKHNDGCFGRRLQWIVPTTNDCGAVFFLPLFLFVQSLDIIPQ